ncbi:MAG: hypothetical protein ACREDY_27350, partial [Bradyrhizobium sp.]
MNLRPFYFVVVVLGAQYRDYFLEYCLPSLLSPNNIPVLAGRRPAKLLMATTAEDWEIMRATAIFRELEKHAKPVFIELPPKGDTPYWYHSIIGHKLCCDMVARDKAYRLLACPDTVFSDGAVEVYHRAALDGAQAVLTFVSHLTRTDKFFQALAEMGLRPEKSARDTGVPIVLPPRNVAALAIRAMHGLSRGNEWDWQNFCGYASTPWWQVPGEEGIVACGMRWDLMLVDYAAIPHDGAILDQRGFDGDYIMRTIGGLDTIYTVRDSDEMYVVSWASLPEPEFPRQRHGDFGKGIGFRASAHGAEFNAMQRALLFVPTYVHSGPPNEKW